MLEVAAKVPSVQLPAVMSAAAKSVVASLLVKTKAAAAVPVVAPLATVADVIVMVGPVPS